MIKIDEIKAWCEELTARLEAWGEPLDREAIACINKLIAALDDQDAALAQYSKAEEEGRLVMLPCRVGDVVYEALKEWDGTECLKSSFSPHVRERKVNFFMFGRSGKLIFEVIDIGGFGATFHAYGDTVFLTRAEAEQALKGDVHNGN